MLCQDKSENFQVLASERVGILPASMAEKKETVADLINRWRSETGLTPSQVQENALKRRLKVSAGYVDDLSNGRTDNPSSKLIKAICAGFGKPEYEFVAVALGWNTTDAEFSSSLLREIDQKHRLLSPAKQKEFRHILEMVNRELQRELKN